MNLQEQTQAASSGRLMMAPPTDLEQLGRKVQVHLKAAHTDHMEIQRLEACQTKQAKSRNDHHRAAGKILIDAKAALPHGEFTNFVMFHCKLKSSRAAELMQVASGGNTLEQIRALNNERQRRHRLSEAAKAKAAAKVPLQENVTEVSPDPEPNRPVRILVTKPLQVPAEVIAAAEAVPLTVSQENLGQLLYAFDHRWPKMNADDRTKFTMHVLDKTNAKAA